MKNTGFFLILLSGLVWAVGCDDGSSGEEEDLLSQGVPHSLEAGARKNQGMGVRGEPSPGEPGGKPRAARRLSHRSHAGFPVRVAKTAIPVPAGIPAKIQGSAKGRQFSAKMVSCVRTTPA